MGIMKRISTSAAKLGLLLPLLYVAAPDSRATSPMITCYLGTNQWCVTQTEHVTAVVSHNNSREWTLMDSGETPLLLRETGDCAGRVSAMPFLGMQEKPSRNAEGREVIEVSFSFGSNANGYPGCVLSITSDAEGGRMIPNNRHRMMHSIWAGPGWGQMISLAKHAGLTN